MSTKNGGQHAKTAVEVKFANTKDEERSAKTAVEVKFVSTIG